MSDSASMRRTTTPVDDFIAANDPDGSLARLDAVITPALPGATRVLWQGVFWGGTDQSIIGYGATVQGPAARQERRVVPRRARPPGEVPQPLRQRRRRP